MTYDIDWIKNKFDRGEPIKYLFFWGHANKDHKEVGKFVLSQWFIAPFRVDDIEYKTSEHWMMASKAGYLETMKHWKRSSTLISLERRKSWDDKSKILTS